MGESYPPDYFGDVEDGDGLNSFGWAGGSVGAGVIPPPLAQALPNAIDAGVPSSSGPSLTLDQGTGDWRKYLTTQVGSAGGKKSGLPWKKIAIGAALLGGIAMYLKRRK